LGSRPTRCAAPRAAVAAAPPPACARSAKSIAYVVLIVYRVVWEEPGHGVRPVVVIPPNALVTASSTISRKSP